MYTHSYIYIYLYIYMCIHTYTFLPFTRLKRAPNITTHDRQHCEEGDTDFNPRARTHTHTHTYVYMYIYSYIYVPSKRLMHTPNIAPHDRQHSEEGDIDLKHRARISTPRANRTITKRISANQTRTRRANRTIIKRISANHTRTRRANRTINKRISTNQTRTRRANRISSASTRIRFSPSYTPRLGPGRGLPQHALLLHPLDMCVAAVAGSGSTHDMRCLAQLDAAARITPYTTSCYAVITNETYHAE